MVDTSTGWNDARRIWSCGVVGWCGIIGIGSDGGTGIRVRLKIEWGNPCGFDSRSEHQGLCTLGGALCD